MLTDVFDAHQFLTGAAGGTPWKQLPGIFPYSYICFFNQHHLFSDSIALLCLLPSLPGELEKLSGQGQKMKHLVQRRKG